MKAQTKIFNRQFIALFLCLFCACYGMYCTNAVFPLYIGSLGGSAGDVGVMTAFYTAAACVFRFIGGNRAAVRKRKSIILLGGVVLAAGITGLALVRTYFLFILFRSIQGAGYAMMTVGASTAVIDVLPPDRLGEGLGISLLASSLALSVSPSVGIRIGTRFGMNAAIASGAVMDLIGMGVILLFCDYEKEPAAPKPSERHSERQRLSLWNYIERRSLRPSIRYLLFLMGFAVSYTYMTMIAAESAITDPGAYFTAASVSQVIARILAGRIADKKGDHLLLVLGGAVSAGSYLMLFAVMTPISYIVSGFLFGMGIGILGPVLNKRAVENLPERNRGMGSATFFVAGDLGVGLGSLVWGGALDSFTPRSCFLIAALWMVIVSASDQLIRDRS